MREHRGLIAMAIFTVLLLITIFFLTNPGDELPRNPPLPTPVLAETSSQPKEEPPPLLNLDDSYPKVTPEEQQADPYAGTHGIVTKRQGQTFKLTPEGVKALPGLGHNVPFGVPAPFAPLLKELRQKGLIQASQNITLTTGLTRNEKRLLAISWTASSYPGTDWIQDHRTDFRSIVEKHYTLSVEPATIRPQESTLVFFILN